MPAEGSVAATEAATVERPQAPLAPPMIAERAADLPHVVVVGGGAGGSSWSPGWATSSAGAARRR